MAQGSVVVPFQVELSDVDRGVYETLPLKLARHPSESAEHLVSRVLAYALEYTEGIAFSGGLSAGDEPAVWVRDLTGQLQTWIEVGQPPPLRLHKGSKASSRVCVYCYKPKEGFFRSFVGHKIHQRQAIEVVFLPTSTIRELASQLSRRNPWSVSRMDGVVYLETQNDGFELPISRTPWVAS